MPSNFKIKEGKTLSVDELKLEYLTGVTINPKLSRLADSVKIYNNFNFTSNTSRLMNSRRSIEQDFDFKCMTELEKIYLLIQKFNGDDSDQRNSANYLICPNVSYVEYSNINDSKLGIVNARFLEFRYIYPHYSFLRLESASNQYYICKVLSLKDWDSPESISSLFQFINELNTHKKFGDMLHQCPHLVTLQDMLVEYDSTAPSRNPTFYMIYKDFHCTLRDLIEFRREHKQPFTISEIVEILGDIIKGIKTLHSLNIAHRNIRPETIFYNGDKKVFMIGSLALTAVVEDAYSCLPCLIGTPFYMPVDMFSDFKIKDKRINFVIDQLKGDIYSLGVIMAELLAVVLSGHSYGFVRKLYGYLKSKKLQDITDLIKLAEEKMAHHCLLIEIVE